MSKKFEEQNGNEKHDEIAGAQSGTDCAQTPRRGSVPWRTGEDCSSQGGARQS
jgi:hypothetical protein